MKTVLIIEDNLAIRENMAEMLELEGYKVFVASNGEKGKALARKKLPDIILCDIMMPEINGHEVFNQLKQDSTTADIPFIFVSAKVEKKEIQAGLDIGANGYVGKPFSLKVLIKKLKRCLSK